MLSLLTDSMYKYIALVLATLLVALGVYAFVLRIEIASLRDDNITLTANEEKHKQAIKQEDKKQEVKIEYVDREVKVIEVQTVQKLVPVKEYVYDSNKTKCQNGLSVLRASGF